MELSDILIESLALTYDDDVLYAWKCPICDPEVVQYQGIDPTWVVESARQHVLMLHILPVEMKKDAAKVVVKEWLEDKTRDWDTSLDWSDETITPELNDALRILVDLPALNRTDNVDA